MSRSVVCYPIPGKPKARMLCRAFAEGAAKHGVVARIEDPAPERLRPGAAVFYGVRPAVAHLWQQAKREGRDWYYLDNAYFDADRQRYFRVCRNEVQAASFEPPVTGHRSPVTEVKPWRQDGRHIVVCPQSDEFMKVVCGWQGDWLAQTCELLRKITRRRLLVRQKNERRPLAADLADAWALVTHMSCAAVEAAIAGVPVFVTGACAASPVAMGGFNRIEDRPSGPDIRGAWAEGLKRMQWTVAEIASGEAWGALHAA